MMIKLICLILDAILILFVYEQSISLLTSVEHFPYITLLLSAGFWLILSLSTTSSYLLGLFEVDSEQPVKNSLRKTVLLLIVTLSGVVIINFFLGKERTGIFDRKVLFTAQSIWCFYIFLSRFFVALKKRQSSIGNHWLVVCSPNLVDRVKKEITRADPQAKWQFEEFFKPDFFNSKNLFSGVIFGIDLQKLDSSISANLSTLRRQGQKFFELSDFYEQKLFKIPVFHLNSFWFILSKGFGLIGNKLQIRIKRLSDLFLALILLFITWPLIVLTGIAVALESGFPIFYRQKRVGLDEKTFSLIKFRSMKKDAEKDGAQWARQNDSRVTLVGQFIRMTRLDELPQIFNVLRGSMSFVGPRPERPEFTEELRKQIPFYQMRHIVRPGITGWAQVCYPYGASVEDAIQKLEFDLYYIKNYSIFLDILICMRTIRVVLFGKGR